MSSEAESANLENRVVIVTGASRGIGRALAQECVARGAHVVGCARRFDAVEPGVVAIEADVTVPADVARVVGTALERFGRIDVLVNNAALAHGELAEVLATNVVAAHAVARAVLAANPRARIVSVSSGIVAQPRAGAAEYVISKHALEGSSRALAADAPDATIVAVQLGAHRTAMNADAHEAAPIAAALEPLLEAMTAPGLHGRTIEAWRSTWPIDTSRADLLAHPLGPSPAARAALAEYAQRGPLHRYPDTTPLRKLLAAEHAVPHDSIVLGAGASEILERILRVLLRPGERLVANTPSWPLFPHLCNERGVVANTVPYRLAAGRVEHDLDAIRAKIDRSTRLVYLISPANPMGCALDAAPFARFLDALPDVTVVVDEAYGEFVTRPDALRAPAMTRVDPRVIAVRTFSKFYGLAALRIGYAIAAPRIARALETASRPFAVSEASVHAACAALGDHEHARSTHILVASGKAARPDALASDAPFAIAPGNGPYFDGRYAMVPLWRTDTTETT